MSGSTPKKPPGGEPPDVHNATPGGKDMENKECEEFPDIHRKIPSTATPDLRRQMEAENEAAGRVYRAVRYILIHDFEFRRGMPEKPEAFPGSELTDHEKAKFVSIYGLLRADNWNDPSLAKDAPTGDDFVIHDDHHRPLVVARKFADAVVGAVQEYTARANLFYKVFNFLKESGSPAPPPASSAAAR